MKEIDIEEFLVWVYRAQRADAVMARGGAGLGRLEQDSVVRVARNAALGTTVDGGGGAGLLPALHPDAECCHELALRHLSDRARHLVIRHARTASRPEWRAPPPPHMVPALNRHGALSIIYDKSRNAIGCRIVPDVGDAAADGFNRVYAEWHGAIDLLARQLRHAGLRRWRVTGPAVSPTPWA